MVKTVNIKEMDLEWIQLIVEAKNLGISKEEVREFFSQHDANSLLITNLEVRK